MRKPAIFTAAFLVATLAFWGTMLTNPPVTQAEESGEARTAASVDPLAMMQTANPPEGTPCDAI